MWILCVSFIEARLSLSTTGVYSALFIQRSICFSPRSLTDQQPSDAAYSGGSFGLEDANSCPVTPRVDAFLAALAAVAALTTSGCAGSPSCARCSTAGKAVGVGGG